MATVYSKSQNAFSQTCSFLQTMPSPLCGLCLLPHFICMQHSLDIGFSHTDKKLLAAGLQFLCFLLDLWLINIAHRLKNLSMKLSLMINGSRVNRRCRVCKWSSPWCAARSQVRFHMGLFSTPWIPKRFSFLFWCKHVQKVSAVAK